MVMAQFEGNPLMSCYDQDSVPYCDIGAGLATSFDHRKQTGEKESCNLHTGGWIGEGRTVADEQRCTHSQGMPQTCSLSILKMNYYSGVVFDCFGLHIHESSAC